VMKASSQQGEYSLPISSQPSEINNQAVDSRGNMMYDHSNPQGNNGQYYGNGNVGGGGGFRQ
jgi:hypothetical protein